MKHLLSWAALSVVAILVVAPAAAAVEGEVELRYWDAELEIDGGSSTETLDFPGPALRAELVFIERLAVALEASGQDDDDDEGSFTLRRIQLDAKWRVLAPSENTYLGVGLGYTDFEFEENEGPIDTDAVRLVVDGSYGIIEMLKVYGRVAYFASVGDLVDNRGTTLATDGSGYDLDLGVGIMPVSMLSIWVGYRTELLDYDRSGGTFDVTNSGLYLGAGVHF
jgi:hypothetical protein